MSINRRQDFRVPEKRLITEFVKDRPFVSSIVNLSTTGMFTLKPIGSLIGTPRNMQLQIELPEADETIWASAEVLYTKHHYEGMGTGIRFKNMAKCHQTLLNDLVEERRRKVMTSMLEEILWRRDMARYPHPLSGPAPKSREHTVPMYRMPQGR